MTTLITRLYADERAARAVEKRLRLEGFPQRTLAVVTQAKEVPESALAARGMAGDTARAYAERIAEGAAAVLVWADYRPLQARQKARDIFAGSDAIDMGGLAEEADVKEKARAEADHAPSVLKTHPRFTVLPIEMDHVPIGPISAQFGLRLLSKRKPREGTIYHGTKRFTEGVAPLLYDRKPAENTLLSHAERISQRFWPMPLVNTHKRRNNVIRGGDLIFQRITGIPSIIRRARDQ